ncbi:hypothetical protein B0H19DRAFT_658936 [Mycena capillaripes]|nr:hypothetical protein B0H19DRAFT_658936 [Mycena capillaripes]
MWPPHSFLSPRSFLPLFLLFLAFCVNGALTNTTFDDADSSFSWTTDWNAVSPSSPCHGCASKPDATQIQNQTYHDGNIGSRGGATEGSFTFQGSAVYIYGIDKDSQPNIVFTLGSTTYTHHYTGSDTDFHYHALFFSATNLASDQTHTVNWAFELNQELFAQTGKLQVGLFDYAVVTSGTADTTTPPSSPGGGGSTGSLTGGSDTSPGGNLISNVSSGSSSASSRSSSTRSTSASHTTNS